jgi:nucleoside-diphosphate-sugar epimerase
MAIGDWTFVTGATGFIGHFVLTELLRQGARCIAMVRGGGGDRLCRLLRDCDPDVVCDARRLRIVVGELPDRLPSVDGMAVARVVHTAGNTDFHRSGEEPARTNVVGTRRLLEWMETHAITDLTHVSTTYVCGAGQDRVMERVERAPPAFNNDYERSKWEAEQIVSDWAAYGGRRLVIARPSIVSGDFHTGRATEFRGFYLVARAVEQLSMRYEAEPRERRHSIRLRLRGDTGGANQLVPVDYVARAIAALAVDDDARGVYHLAHPKPPTNGELKSWLEQLFDVSGGEFVGERDVLRQGQDADDQVFCLGLRALEAYFSATTIDCSRALARLGQHGVACPPIDFEYVRRCVEYAQARRWGRAVNIADIETRAFGRAYFERFLPVFLAQSSVGRIAPIHAIIRFAIDRHEWVCRFAEGRIESVQRGNDGVNEDFGYRTTAAGFWHAISGEVDGEALFASGEADVFGDVEAALKMAAILREFTREFPCDRQRLERYMESA